MSHCNFIDERHNRPSNLSVLYLGKGAHDAKSGSALQKPEARIYILNFDAASSRTLGKKRCRHAEHFGNPLQSFGVYAIDALLVFLNLL
jgi:hypothetical protein